MRYRWVLWGALAAANAGAQSRYLGYTPASTVAERTVEQRMQRLVSARSLSRLHAPLAARPHPAGSAGSRQVITYLDSALRSFGLTVERHDYQVHLSAPRRVQVTLTGPATRELVLSEPPLAEDPTSSHPELGPGYIAYSASGDVRGEVVYANYGLPADYDTLRARGVDVTGRIMLVRYGRSHRAVKVHTAQGAGARAVVLYSDPADDGFVKGVAWPGGYWRGEEMLQRGNAKLSWYFHGDPLTPGVAARGDAPRLDPATAPTLPRIPVVAISWGEARHILSALGGVEAPALFAGRVPGVAYRLGPGPATVRVQVQMDDGLRPITNVVATLRGRTEPDRVVLLGGHHDAWTFGGVDPGTGSAALLELARVLGQMARGGWRPQRTIQVAFWDAEEFGLIGSTEHAEHFRDQLREQLITYVNTDMYMRGRFDAGGVPSLRDFVVDVARSVPARGGSVFSDWAAQAARARPGAIPELKALGSGADFVPFQDFLGVPTLSIEFIGANGYGFGTYHTNYDSRAYVEQVADPGFQQGVILVKTLGALALRMANAEVLPFRFGHYGEKLEAGMATLVDAMRGRSISDTAPTAELLRLASRVRTAGTALDQAMDRRLAQGGLRAARRRLVNDRLAKAEQTLIDASGENTWYQHVVQGWNIYSLYDGQLFPAAHKALRGTDVAAFMAETMRVRAALDRLARWLEETLAIVNGGA